MFCLIFQKFHKLVPHARQTSIQDEYDLKEVRNLQIILKMLFLWKLTASNLKPDIAAWEKSLPKLCPTSRKDVTSQCISTMHISILTTNFYTSVCIFLCVSAIFHKVCSSAILSQSTITQCKTSLFGMCQPEMAKTHRKNTTITWSAGFFGTREEGGEEENMERSCKDCKLLKLFQFYWKDSVCYVSYFTILLFYLWRQ